MGPGRRHTRSAGIISGTGVQKWTRPVNSLPYLTLPCRQILNWFELTIDSKANPNWASQDINIQAISNILFNSPRGGYTSDTKAEEHAVQFE